MKTLAILGSDGMLGSDLVKYFNKKYIVTGINRDNYKLNIEKNYDIFINANGNSKRYWANKNPHLDFVASTASVHKSMFDFNCGLYIYISSIDVYGNRSNPKNAREATSLNIDNLQPYGLHKYLSELIVKKYKNKYLIIRPSYILGSNLKKGPIFDLLNSKPLFITKQSKFQLVTSDVIGEVISKLIRNQVKNTILNIGGVGTFKFIYPNKYFKNKMKIVEDAETQIYEMNVSKLKSIYQKLKTSEQYLTQFLKDVKYKFK